MVPRFLLSGCIPSADCDKSVWPSCGSIPSLKQSRADWLFLISVGSLKRDPRCPPHQRSRPPRRWPRNRSLTCSEESSCRHRHLRRWVESRSVVSDSSPSSCSSSHAAVLLCSPTSVLESLFSTWTLMPSSRTRACRQYHRLVFSSAAAHLDRRLLAERPLNSKSPLLMSCFILYSSAPVLQTDVPWDMWSVSLYPELHLNRILGPVYTETAFFE